MIARRIPLVVVLLAAACSTTPGRSVGHREPADHTPEATATPRASNAVVTRVVDGDTIHVEYRGRDVDVRLIGVDSPETVAPGQPVECGGPAASRFTERRLDGRRVRLEFDVQRIDPYGRTLAYVWLDGRLFNRALVARGYAQVATYPPDVKYVEVFLAAQRHARSHGLGLWGSCTETRSLVGPGTGSSRCDLAYPTVCIPPPPPDLDCLDVRFRHFKVLPPDPQHFDGDHNGIGCEM